MNEQLQTINASNLKVINFLENNKIKVLNTEEANYGRYLILNTLNLSNQQREKYLLVFKRDYFRAFGRIFQIFGESGMGETINQEDLQNAVRLGVRNLLFTYPTGFIYEISVSDFLIHSHKRKNDYEDKWTRSINIKHLKRLN